MKKRCTTKLSIIVMLVTVFAPFSLLAQNVSVSGTVIDDMGQPVIGATVSVKDGSALTITGSAGEYTIQSPASGTLVYKFLGYITREEAVGNRTLVDVRLEIDASTIDDVVVVGYGTMRRGSVTGAVSNVRGSEMIKTKNENTQNMLTGRVSGVRMWQKTAEPGTYASNFDIRGYEGGGVLVVIDGVPRTVSDFQRLNAADIEDVSVLKDASAAIYGARSASGVLLVTTKKGEAGKTRTRYNGSFTFQTPASMPKLVDAVDAMQLRNEEGRTMFNPTYRYPGFTEELMEQYRNGSLQSADWNSVIFADWAPQTQHDISISGGTEKTKYYVGLGQQYTQSFIKSGDNNYNRFNVRSNVSAVIAKGMTFELGMSGIMDKRHTPWYNSQDIIRNYWAQGPLVSPYADPEQTMINFAGLDKQENAAAFMDSDISGERIYNKKKFMSSATLNYDFGTITSALQGLSLKGMFSYDYEMDSNTNFWKQYKLYAYNDVTDSYSEFLFGNQSSLQREFYDKSMMLGQFVLNYNRTFGKHEIGGLVGWEVQTDKADNFYAYADLDFTSPYLFMGDPDTHKLGMDMDNEDFHEYAMQGLLGRLNYAYNDRYLFEAQFRYDASSKLAPGYQWDFFPSVSAGWRVSEEPFVKETSLSSVISHLKLRASYGKLGNDNAEYAWLSAYTYPRSAGSNNGWYNEMIPGYFVNGVFVNAMGVDALPNIGITWATSNTLNLGVEFEAWRGLFGFTFEYFDRKRKGIYQRNTADMPTDIGATAPQENLNSDRQYGMELELSHRNKVGEFEYRVKAMATITRRMWLTAVQNSNYSSSWDKWRNDNLNNRFQGVQFGFEGDGRFQNWDDILNYPLYQGTGTLPGDYKYEDWNGDGIINDDDKHPYAFDQTPWLNYSLSFDTTWKKFDLSLLFQGSAMGSMNYGEPYRAMWSTNVGGGALEMFMDRWHPKDINGDPWDPAQEWESGWYPYNRGHLSNEASSHNRVSTAYLRLKSVELGYTIPKIEALDTMSLRVYFNAYNLLTFTGVKFVDPEHPDSDGGRLYPLNKTYTFGVSLSF